MNALSDLDRPWSEAPLCALDLEGTGAQDREFEAILEVAAAPIIGGSPDVSSAYESLVNPGRPVPRRPWISPGLTDEVLSAAPSLAQVGPELEACINGRYMVGHSVGVDWKLLHLRHPSIRPTGLIDTLRLARHLQVPAPRGLGALLDRFGLRGEVESLVPEGRPHRALWDTVAAAVLLARLVEDDPSVRTLSDLVAVASVPLGPPEDEPTLF